MRVNGAVDPNYMILHVIYAPPGTSGSGSRSSVSYGDASSMQTELKTNQSFKNETEVSAEVGLPLSAKITASAGYTTENSSDHGLLLKKTQSTTRALDGGRQDGINHDLDVIYLWLNPRVDISAHDGAVDWTASLKDGFMDIQWVYVGSLKDPPTVPMADGVAAALASSHITSADYPQILSADPFANGDAPIDPDRFLRTTTSFPYEPPAGPNEPSPSLRMTMTNETATSAGTRSSTSYSVGMTVQASEPMSWLTNLKFTDKMTWTHSSTQTQTNGATESASVTVTGPGFGYTGSTDLAVYYDTLFGAFMFTPIVHTPALAGVLSDAQGQPLAHEPVDLVVGGTSYHTVTGQNGEYRFFDAPAGQTATLRAAGTTQAEVSLGGSGTVTRNIRISQ